MVALAILFLQLTLGIANPTPAQINTVTPAQAASVSGGGSGVTAPPYDTIALS